MSDSTTGLLAAQPDNTLATQGPELLGTLVRYPDLAERTYETLKEEILTGRIPPGSEMIIVNLAHRLGVSRSPVKHAVARLCGEGLAVQISGKGYFVSQVDEEQRRHLLEARLLVEVAAAERGAQLATESQLVAMKGLLQEMSRLVDPEGRYLDFCALMEKDKTLHSILVETSRNPYLVQFHRVLNFHVFQVRMHFAAQLGNKRASPGLQEHRAILSAFESRNVAEAVSAVSLHIRNSMASLGIGTSA